MNSSVCVRDITFQMVHMVRDWQQPIIIGGLCCSCSTEKKTRMLWEATLN